MTTEDRIYLSPPHMGPHERELLLEAFDSNWIAPLGPQVDAFEREMAAKLGCAGAAALSSGTAALHLALRILGVGPGDEVICPSLTFIASVSPVTYVGASPVFIDSTPDSWNLDPNLLEDELKAMDAAGRRPKAVIAVDLFGQCADYDAIGELCGRYEVPLIEDAAEALGATWRGRPAGTFGAMGVLSFNGNKIITTSGGGMLLSDRTDWLEQARFLATQARDPAPHYEHTQIGHNYRMSNLLAAIGRGQLRVLDERVAARRRINAEYREALQDLPGIAFMPEAEGGRATFWLTCITVDPERFGADVQTLRECLNRCNIEARPLWKPMHLQPVFAGARYRGRGVSNGLFATGLCLPSGSCLTDPQFARIVRIIRETYPALTDK